MCGIAGLVFGAPVEDPIALGRITSYNVCYTKLLRKAELHYPPETEQQAGERENRDQARITSYNVCYTKLLRVKAGLIVGAQYGTGALRVEGKTVGYYNTVAASYGLQAGAQEFGYALIFMTQSSLDYLKKSAGWEIGVGPSIVVVDEGLARSLTTTTAKEDIYAFFFSQKGLMAGLGLQGSKISKITPDK